MKKKMIMLLAGSLMAMSASSAFASFADLELIRVVYDRNGLEVATDLGSISSILAAPSTTIAENFSAVANATGFVSYFALDRSTNQMWTSGKTTASSVVTGGNVAMNSFRSGSLNTYSLYNTQGGTNYTGAASMINSYKNKISATQGTFAGAINFATRLNSEASLTNLATAPIIQNLYFFKNGLTNVAADKFGVSALVPVTVVVPFGFFVNSAVTAQTCTAGLIGNYATAASQCDTAPAKGDGVLGAASTITNISREEATLIFSQSVADWSDLGSYFTAQPVVACLRHAGSGTHAALDQTVMNSGWGNNIANTETAGSIWFNQGSSDMMKCINGNSTASTNGSLIGAIGYADADQAIGAAKISQNVKQLKYNGFYPTRTAIRNGLYDFYTNAWLYTNPAIG